MNQQDLVLVAEVTYRKPMGATSKSDSVVVLSTYADKTFDRLYQQTTVCGQLDSCVEYKSNESARQHRIIRQKQLLELGYVVESYSYGMVFQSSRVSLSTSFLSTVKILIGALTTTVTGLLVLHALKV